MTDTLGHFPAILIAYLTSAIALAVPFFNTTTADVKNIMSLSAIEFSLTSVLIGAVWVLSGIITSTTRHINAMMCALHACGIPGVLIAIFALVGR